MIDEGVDGAGRLKKRLEGLLRFIAGAECGRHIRECEGYCLLSWGITPKTCRKYLEWLVIYGKIMWTGPAHNRVKKL